MDFEDFKRGNKLIMKDILDWTNGDFWPWMQTLSTVILIAVILFIPFGYAVSLFVVWLVFNIFAMWRTYKLETKDIKDA